MFNEDNNSLFSTPKQDITNNINDTGMDLPPELGEIKELSDAPIAKAPTMEVLSPMNVIPENFDGNNILDNYDAGIINQSSLESSLSKEDSVPISTNIETQEKYNSYETDYKPGFLEFSSPTESFEEKEKGNNSDENIVLDKKPASLAAEVFDRVVSKIQDKGYDIELEKYDNEKQIKLEIIIKK